MIQRFWRFSRVALLVALMTGYFQSCAHLRATDPGDSPQTMLFRFLSARELNRRFRATFTLGLGD